MLKCWAEYVRKVVLFVHNEKQFAVLYGRVSAKGDSPFFLEVGCADLGLHHVLLGLVVRHVQMRRAIGGGMKDSAKRFEWALEEAVKHSNERTRATFV